ncbi:MAG: tetratricopeptide repeat-containing sulfotransferase family protein [Gammaproteobacteria bacterium]
MATSVISARRDLQRRMQAAVGLQRGGQPEKALGIYRELMTERPGFADAFHFAALAAHSLGREEDARRWLLEAERLAPEHVDFLLNASRFFMEIKELEEAECRAARARRIAPQDPRAVVQHTEALSRLDRGDEAIADLEKVAQAYPTDTGIWLLLARCLLQGGYRERARRCYEKGCCGPYALDGRLEFEADLRMSGELDAARDQCEIVVREGNGRQRGAAELELGLIAAQLGDRKAAVQHSERALVADPESHCEPWVMRIRAADKDDLPGLLPELEALREKVQSDEVYFLDFALGQIYERLGRYPASWERYLLGNRGRRQAIAYDPEERAQFFDDMRRGVDADFIARHERAGNPTRLPVFIVGMPRSGTTLIERVLGGHSAVREGGEMNALDDILRRRAGPRARRRMPLWLADCSTDEIRAIGDEWLSALRERAQGADRVTDKLPGNFAWIGLIKTCFPNATVVHVKRDPRDVFMSSWVMVSAMMLRYTYDTDEFMAYYRGYRGMIEHWKSIGIEDGFVEVEYREMVENLEATTTRILDAAGLEWEPGCAGFAERTGNVATASMFQVRKPLYSTSIGRWKNFREQLGPLADLSSWS